MALASRPSVVARGARRPSPARALREWPRFLTLLLLAALFLAPLYWMVSTSLKTESATIAAPVQWWPAQPTLENYRSILTSPDANILRWVWNSLFSSVVFTGLHVLLCALTAYPLARMRFPGREAWFWFILASLMIPGVVTLIPQYIMMLRLNWIDTYHALIWPGLPAVFGVFLLRQFFLTIPRELEEAARMDGAGPVQILRHVILPLSTPALATLAVFTFLGAWNNYVWPLFVVHGDMQTLPVGLASFQGRYVIQYGKLMAGTAIATIPVLFVYLAAQRYFEQGIVLTGMKE